MSGGWIGNHASVADDEPERDDRPDEEEAAVLPAREAMSLISPDPAAGGGVLPDASTHSETEASLPEEESSDAGFLQT